jgi:hypothetical protein
MSKYINKTQPTEISPSEYIKQYENQNVVVDCLELLNIFEKVTGNKPVLWNKVIGFGKYHYQQKASQGDWYIAGFAPRATTIAIYIMGKVEGMEKLGKYKMSGSCIHIKKLADIDLKVLEELISQGMKYIKEKYGILE